MVLVISKDDGGRRNRGNGVSDAAERIIVIVIILRHLQFFINSLPQPARGVFIHVTNFRSVRINLGRGAALHVVAPVGGPPHRVRQAFEPAAFAPLKLRHPV